MRIRKILMPTDFSDCADTALTHAIFLAEQFGAELHFLHVVALHTEDPFHPTHHFPDNEEIFLRLQEISASEMRELLRAHKTETLKIHEHQRRAIAPGPEIVDFALQEHVDLIIMGGHGRRGLRRLLLGSVAEEVVQTAPCPVLTLRAAKVPSELERIERIVVPIDFSEPSRDGLVAAREWAEIYGAALDIVHVVQHPAYPQYYEGIFPSSSDGGFPQAAVKVEEALTRFVKDTEGPTIESELYVLEGGAADRITAFAKERKADLIVMSTRGLTGLEHALLGSVAERVVRRAECPVLTWKV